MLKQYIIYNLTKNQKIKQYAFLIFIKVILREYFLLFKSQIFGLKIQIKGRINGAQRSKIRTIMFGNTPLQTYNIKINYTFSKFITKDGAFGLKIWFFHK